MITFLQQSKSCKNTFAKAPSKNNSTHFRIDGGPIKPISELGHAQALTNNEVQPLATSKWDGEKEPDHNIDDLLEPPNYQDEAESRTVGDIISDGLLDLPKFD